ncbi:MAG: thiamine phosphate synthase [Nannocystales bacterium]
MIPRLLAITPPRGPVATTCVDVAADLGLALAVLLRDPGVDPATMLHPEHRLGPLVRSARAADIPVLGSCAMPDVVRFAPLARDAGLCGLQLRGDPNEDELLRARAAWPEALLGASVHGGPRASTADYMVFAPVFAPRTAAAFAKPAAGVESLAAWTTRHPRVFALGGVTAETAGSCMHAGAYGLAGISTFLGSADALADTLQALARALARAPHVPPRPRG